MLYIELNKELAKLEFLYIGEGKSSVQSYKAAYPLKAVDIHRLGEWINGLFK
jgi:hypothetical protein